MTQLTVSLYTGKSYTLPDADIAAEWAELPEGFITALASAAEDLEAYHTAQQSLIAAYERTAQTDADRAAYYDKLTSIHLTAFAYADGAARATGVTERSGAEWLALLTGSRDR
jgi:histidinol dehydrogenase